MKGMIGCASRDEVGEELLRKREKLLLRIKKMEEIQVILGGMEGGLLGLCYQIFQDNLLQEVIIDKAYYKEGVDTKVKQVDSIFDRLKACYEKSDFALFLEGGIGTYAELFAFLDEKRTRDETYPIYLYNETGCYDCFFALLEDGVKKGTISSVDASYFHEIKEEDQLIKELEELLKRKENKIK